MSQEKNIISEDLELCRKVFKEIKDLKVENARLKHQIMLQQALNAIHTCQKPAWREGK